MKQITKSPRANKVIGKMTNNAQKGDLVEIPMLSKPKREWYEWLTPVQGIKWGATVTLIGYTVAERRDSEGLMIAAGIVTFFLFLEWTVSAYKEFRRAK